MSLGSVVQTFKTTDGQLREISTDFFIAIGLGLIPGHEAVYINGYNPAVGATKETIMPSSANTTYPFLTGPATLTIVSDDADDDLVGTGARTVTVEGLDANYNEITDPVDMDGLTPVTTNIQFFRVNNFKVASIGATGRNEGTITLKNGADFLGQISFASGGGEGRSQTAVYTVPAEKQLVLCRLFGSTVGGNNAHIHSAIRSEGAPWITERHFTLKDSPFSAAWTYGFPVDEKSDIEVLAHASGGGAEIDAGMCGFLRPMPV